MDTEPQRGPIPHASPYNAAKPTRPSSPLEQHLPLSQMCTAESAQPKFVHPTLPRPQSVRTRHMNFPNVGQTGIKPHRFSSRGTAIPPSGPHPAPPTTRSPKMAYRNPFELHFTRSRGPSASHGPDRSAVELGDRLFGRSKKAQHREALRGELLVQSGNCHDLSFLPSGNQNPQQFDRSALLSYEGGGSLSRFWPISGSGSNESGEVLSRSPDLQDPSSPTQPSPTTWHAAAVTNTHNRILASPVPLSRTDNDPRRWPQLQSAHPAEPPSSRTHRSLSHSTQSPTGNSPPHVDAPSTPHHPLKSPNCHADPTQRQIVRGESPAERRHLTPTGDVLRLRNIDSNPNPLHPTSRSNHDEPSSRHLHHHGPAGRSARPGPSSRNVPNQPHPIQPPHPKLASPHFRHRHIHSHHHVNHYSYSPPQPERDLIHNNPQFTATRSPWRGPQLISAHRHPGRHNTPGLDLSAINSPAKRSLVISRRDPSQATPHSKNPAATPLKPGLSQFTAHPGFSSPSAQRNPAHSTTLALHDLLHDSRETSPNPLRPRQGSTPSHDPPTATLPSSDSTTTDPSDNAPSPPELSHLKPLTARAVEIANQPRVPYNPCRFCHIDSDPRDCAHHPPPTLRSLNTSRSCQSHGDGAGDGIVPKPDTEPASLDIAQLFDQFSRFLPPRSLSATPDRILTSMTPDTPPSPTTLGPLHQPGPSRYFFVSNYSRNILLSLLFELDLKRSLDGLKQCDYTVLIPITCFIGQDNREYGSRRPALRQSSPKCYSTEALVNDADTNIDSPAPPPDSNQGPATDPTDPSTNPPHASPPQRHRSPQTSSPKTAPGEKQFHVGQPSPPNRRMLLRPRYGTPTGSRSIAPSHSHSIASQLSISSTGSVGVKLCSCFPVLDRHVQMMKMAFSCGKLEQFIAGLPADNNSSRNQRQDIADNESLPCNGCSPNDPSNSPQPKNPTLDDDPDEGSKEEAVEQESRIRRSSKSSPCELGVEHQTLVFTKVMAAALEPHMTSALSFLPTIGVIIVHLSPLLQLSCGTSEVSCEGNENNLSSLVEGPHESHVQNSAMALDPWQLPQSKPTKRVIPGLSSPFTSPISKRRHGATSQANQMLLQGPMPINTTRFERNTMPQRPSGFTSPGPKFLSDSDDFLSPIKPLQPAIAFDLLGSPIGPINARGSFPNDFNSPIGNFSDHRSGFSSMVQTRDPNDTYDSDTNDCSFDLENIDTDTNPSMSMTSSQVTSAHLSTSALLSSPSPTVSVEHSQLPSPNIPPSNEDNTPTKSRLPLLTTATWESEVSLGHVITPIDAPSPLNQTPTSDNKSELKPFVPAGENHVPSPQQADQSTQPSPPATSPTFTSRLSHQFNQASEHELKQHLSTSNLSTGNILKSNRPIANRSHAQSERLSSDDLINAESFRLSTNSSMRLSGESSSFSCLRPTSLPGTPGNGDSLGSPPPYDRLQTPLEGDDEDNESGLLDDTASAPIRQTTPKFALPKLPGAECKRPDCEPSELPEVIKPPASASAAVLSFSTHSSQAPSTTHGSLHTSSGALFANNISSHRTPASLLSATPTASTPSTPARALPVIGSNVPVRPQTSGKHEAVSAIPSRHALHLRPPETDDRRQKPPNPAALPTGHSESYDSFDVPTPAVPFSHSMRFSSTLASNQTFSTQPSTLMVRPTAKKTTRCNSVSSQPLAMQSIALNGAPLGMSGQFDPLPALSVAPTAVSTAGSRLSGRIEPIPVPRLNPPSQPGSTRSPSGKFQASPGQISSVCRDGHSATGSVDEIHELPPSSETGNSTVFKRSFTAIHTDRHAGPDAVPDGASAMNQTMAIASIPAKGSKRVLVDAIEDADEFPIEEINSNRPAPEPSIVFSSTLSRTCSVLLGPNMNATLSRTPSPLSNRLSCPTNSAVPSPLSASPQADPASPCESRNAPAPRLAHSGSRHSSIPGSATPSTSTNTPLPDCQVWSHRSSTVSSQHGSTMSLQHPAKSSQARPSTMSAMTQVPQLATTRPGGSTVALTNHIVTQSSSTVTAPPQRFQTAPGDAQRFSPHHCSTPLSSVTSTASAGHPKPLETTTVSGSHQRLVPTLPSPKIPLPLVPHPRHSPSSPYPPSSGLSSPQISDNPSPDGGSTGAPQAASPLSTATPSQTNQSVERRLFHSPTLHSMASGCTDGSKTEPVSPSLVPQPAAMTGAPSHYPAPAPLNLSSTSLRAHVPSARPSQQLRVSSSAWVHSESLTGVGSVAPSHDDGSASLSQFSSRFDSVGNRNPATQGSRRSGVQSIGKLDPAVRPTANESQRGGGGGGGGEDLSEAGFEKSASFSNPSNATSLHSHRWPMTLETSISSSNLITQQGAWGLAEAQHFAFGKTTPHFAPRIPTVDPRTRLSDRSRVDRIEQHPGRGFETGSFLSDGSDDDFFIAAPNAARPLHESHGFTPFDLNQSRDISNLVKAATSAHNSTMQTPDYCNPNPYVARDPECIHQTRTQPPSPYLSSRISTNTHDPVRYPTSPPDAASARDGRGNPMLSTPSGHTTLPSQHPVRSTSQKVRSPEASLSRHSGTDYNLNTSCGPGLLSSRSFILAAGSEFSLGTSASAFSPQPSTHDSAVQRHSSTFTSHQQNHYHPDFDQHSFGSQEPKSRPRHCDFGLGPLPNPPDSANYLDQADTLSRHSRPHSVIMNTIAQGQSKSAASRPRLPHSPDAPFDSSTVDTGTGAPGSRLNDSQHEGT